MIGTERLILRPWREEDIAPFCAMMRDPAVMRFFPAMPDRWQSLAMMGRIQARIARDGFGFMAVERRRDGAFPGFCGIGRVGPALPFAPAVEIGWRLARHAWGQGYATESPRAWMAHGFGLGLAEIVAMAAPANTRSTAVMQRIGVTRDPGGDFDHPAVPEGPLKRHVLWRISRPRRATAAPRAPADPRSPAAGSAGRGHGG